MNLRAFMLRASLLGLLLAVTAAGSRAQTARPAPATPLPAAAPADPAATPETRRLLSSLYQLLPTGTLFGHQDDLAYGLTAQGQRWVAEPNRSDVKSVAGSYPAVFGWELGHLELDSARSLDAVPFASIRQYVRQVYEMGGVNTISWHLDNPHNGKSAWDTTRTVRYILPGGPDHARYVQYLDRLAAFLGSLKGSRGESIPVIFRPFHEHTGSWFWWGEKNCTAAEYQQLWRFTVDYLRREKKLHNLLLAYSSADVTSEAHYLERYPGPDMVDVIGFDAYCFGDGAAYRRLLATQLPILTRVARSHHKLPALTETGFEKLPTPDWWTGTLLPALQGYPLAYAMVWRNGRPDHFYAPYPGQTSAADFQRFARNPRILLLSKLAPRRIYRR